MNIRVNIGGGRGPREESDDEEEEGGDNEDREEVVVMMVMEEVVQVKEANRNGKLYEATTDWCAYVLDTKSLCVSCQRDTTVSTHTVTTHSQHNIYSTNSSRFGHGHCSLPHCIATDTHTFMFVQRSCVKILLLRGTRLERIIK